MVETNESLGEGLNTSPLVFPTCFRNNLLNLYNKMGLFLSEGVKCRIQVAGHCFTITEKNQTFAKMLTLGLNTIFWGLC